MSRRAQRLLAVQGHVRRLFKSLKNREQPRAIILEDIFAHNEHIAEARAVTMQERIGICLVIRVHLAQDVIHVPQITQVQFWRVLVNLDGGAVAVNNLA